MRWGAAAPSGSTAFVHAEKQEAAHQESVRAWLAQIPSWLQVQPLHSSPDPKLDYLDDGEREAIALAEELQADDILVDELLARKEAARRRLRFIRTLGILRRAAQLDSNLSFLGARLEQTTSYLGSDLIRSLLDDDAQRRNL